MRAKIFSLPVAMVIAPPGLAPGDLASPRCPLQLVDLLVATVCPSWLPTRQVR